MQRPWLNGPQSTHINIGYGTIWTAQTNWCSPKAFRNLMWWIFRALLITLFLWKLLQILSEKHTISTWKAKTWTRISSLKLRHMPHREEQSSVLFSVWNTHQTSWATASIDWQHAFRISVYDMPFALEGSCMSRNVSKPHRVVSFWTCRWCFWAKKVSTNMQPKHTQKSTKQIRNICWKLFFKVWRKK